jgi:hypothetical protein
LPTIYERPWGKALKFGHPELLGNTVGNEGAKMCLLREVEEAEQQGRDLARSGGLASSNPYADRLDLHSAWLRGYRSAWATVIVPALPDGDKTEKR